MHSNTFYTTITTAALIALAIPGASAYWTKIDKSDGANLAEETILHTGYEIKDWWNLVDKVMAQCDNNGCDVNIEECDKRFCIKIDGDNDHFEPGNIQKVVGDFVKEAMQTEEVEEMVCGNGMCTHKDATKYTIPTYLSLARYISTGKYKDRQQGLYKISISGESSDTVGHCEDVLKLVESVGGLFSGGSLLGTLELFACD